VDLGLLVAAGCDGGRLRGPDAGRPQADAGLDVGPSDSGEGRPDAYVRVLDAGRRPADPPGDETIELVVSWVRLPVEDPEGAAPGFDLDGHVTLAHDATGCGQADFVLPPTLGSGEGIDNQVVPVYAAVRSVNPEADFDQDLANAVASGDAIILMRMAHVGDLVNDGEIEVSIMTGRVVGGGAPRMVAHTIEGTSHQVIAPGQRFEIDPTSFVGGRPRAIFEDAYIVDGRLVTRGTSFSLRVPASMDRVFVLDLRDLRVAGRVSMDGLELGVLGGYALTDDLVRGIQSALPPDDSISPELIRSVLETYADIDADGDAECEALSAALRLEATQATFVEPTP
jgi:hypothetical protein